ncbi:Oxidoreductase FAD-binding domain-containing protein [Cladophialophora immunda]|nr:Oxidoreductase FAD-binding domain-containing protein [Cladophialophora immunda]
MLARCSREAPNNFKRAFRPLWLGPWRRFSSSTHENQPKPPDANKHSPNRAYRRLAVGVALGGGLYGLWQAYLYSLKRDSFVAYTLTAKEPVSSTASIFHLVPKQQNQNYEIYKDAWRRGIWNVQFKQPQLQIVRAYTPLPPTDEKTAEEKGEIRFLIRKDPHGEVSSYLHRLPIGADIEMRGPSLDYELTPEVRQVVFFAGGTGIAPALQVAHALFEGSSPAASHEANKDRKLHILWANRMREDCVGGVSDEPPAERSPPKPTWSGFFSKPKQKPLPPVSEKKGVIVQELEALKQRYPGQITVEYFVNAEDTWIDEDAVLRALSRFDDKDFSTGYATSQEKRQILISGPPGFIAYLAGPKEWRNGREEQGAVSKLVAHAISKNPHNVKVWKI